MFITYHNIEN